MKLTLSLPILLLASFPGCAASESNRTDVSVSFEFQLEVNNTQVTGTTQEVLDDIDSTILSSLQTTLPNGAPDGDELPNVQFSGVSSEIFSACFTKSAQCSLVRSSIAITYEGDKPEHSVEFVALRLVQDFLKNFSILNANVLASYAFPSMVETLAQFKMDSVSGRMSDTDISVLRETFVEVFGAIVFAIEGDTEVIDAKFVYQDLFEINDRRLSPANQTYVEHTEENGEYTLSTDLKVTGFCRDCTSPQFGEVVNGVIVDNLIAFQSKLKINGNAVDSVYFTNVTSISFAVPELPSKLPPIEDESIFDGEAPVVKSKVPWFLIFGATASLCILCSGAYLVFKDRSDFVKDEEFSTSESEGAGSYGDEGYTQEGDYTNGERTEGDGTYTELDEYQVETIAPTEEGTTTSNNYEVYVF
eukprot:CAMPEP_0117012540 /NCGR_PEP_ID=MMETSP0472-20121206/10532_1 /TAXON_ID=693140 ORGANISM="Tiarina fusus, Strain LIS" /NCGR_SAMPLE_ID=MMETSP0472 /ASSEMBLY_ACC=CAM_ASM_000603 /LENGTH=416 /DNA_ID=CAMNT_0004715635 /DNA_START=179 /DNA_END=1429 /DNA_ORIENTATION=-